jgi:dihydrolipoamide dehydrogenase
MIVRGDRILSQEEPDVSETLAEALKRDGIQLHFNATVEQVTHANGVFVLTLSNGEKLEGKALLVAIGRKPNTMALNVPAAGIELDEKGYIKIDNQFRTTTPGVYAIGDVARQPAFTHVSWEDYRRLKANLCGENRTRSDRSATDLGEVKAGCAKSANRELPSPSDFLCVRAIEYP